MRLNQLLDKCENIEFDTPLMIGINNLHIMYSGYTEVPEHLERKFVRFFRVYQWYVSIELED